MTAQGVFHNPCFLLPWEFFACLLMVGTARWGTGHTAGLGMKFGEVDSIF